MALRIGTGGLKYPLPANTQAQQSIAAASSGGSAAASTFSANRQFAANKMRVQADLANAAADRDFRARSQLEGQAFRAQQEYYDREHQKGAQLESQDFRAGQAELDRNFDAFRQQSGQAFQENQAALDRDFTAQREQAQFDREQTDKDADIQAGIKAGTLQLTPAAQKQLDEIAAARAGMGSDWTQAERDEFEAKAQEEERRIRRTAEKRKDPTGTDLFNQNTTWVDEETGIGYPNAEAIPGKRLVPYNVEDRSPLIPAPDTSKEDQRRRAEDEKRARELTGEINPETKKRYTPKEAAQAAVDERAAFESTFNSSETAPGVPAGETNPLAPAQGMGESVAQRSGGVPPVQPAAPPSDVRGQGWYNPAPPSSMSVYRGGPGNVLQSPSGTAQPRGALPEPEVQSMVGDIRRDMKDVPLDEGKETPELRSFLDSNLENIARYQNVPLDQVPPEARGALDFYGRYIRSATQGQPIVLRTPEEAAMLPPGTVFMDEQGNQRRTKKKGEP